jgi:threonine/homoserine/homoserine lactone efflux protein
VHSLPAFLLLALVLTLTPGPATAFVLRVAARDGRRAAFQGVLGHSAGVLLWGALSALGVSGLILASRLAFDVLRIAGALVLIYLGLRSLLHCSEPAARRGPTGWRTGLLTAAANPKLAVFFVALFPQFLRSGAAVLPNALVMATLVVLFDVLWFGTLIWTVDRAARALKPRVTRIAERVTGGVLVGLGVGLAVESRG